jgi:hypothetical protein
VFGLRQFEHRIRDQVVNDGELRINLQRLFVECDSLFV